MDMIGHNLAPADADPLKDRLTEEYSAMLERRDELAAALGRMPDEISDEDLAQKATDFVKQITAARKNAETTRVSEKEPFLASSRIVDGWFKQITVPLDDIKKTVLSRLTTYQRAKEAEERRRLAEEEKRQREEAARLAEEAAAREAAAQTENDLEDAIRVAAEATQAAADAHEAGKAAEVKAADLSRTRGEFGGVSSLVTFWDFRSLDRDTIDLNALRHHLPVDALEKALRAFVKAGGREIAGAEIFENTRARVA